MILKGEKMECNRYRIWIDKDKYNGLYRCRVRDRVLKKNHPLGKFETAQEAYSVGNRFVKEIKIQEG